MSSVKTVEIIGPAGRRVVNECDLKAWRGKGYRLPTEPDKAPDAGREGKAGDQVDLRKTALEYGINPEGMTDRQVVQALKKAGWTNLDQGSKQ